MNTFERNPKKTTLFVLVVLFLLLEIFIRALASGGFITHKHYQTNRKPHFLDDINRDFGVWHYANRTATHKGNCFICEYKSNSYGAVDKERTKKSEKPRVIVLGDSFVEGYGVNAEDRFTNILEKDTSVEHLNFGTSGDFGSIQQMVLYRSLASKFDHDIIYIFALPDNDFEDNTPPNTDKKPRYAPYYDKDFNIVYPVTFEDRRLLDRPVSKCVMNYAANKSYLVNQVRQFIKKVKKYDFSKQTKDLVNRNSMEIEEAAKNAHYYVYSKQDMEILLHSYEDIIKVAGKKKIVIFSIPTYRDIYRHLTSEQKPPFSKELRAFTSKYENVFFYDLLDGIVDFDFKGKDVIDMFFTCDGHWAPYGHRITSKLVEKYINDNFSIYGKK